MRNEEDQLYQNKELHLHKKWVTANYLKLELLIIAKIFKDRN